MEYLLYICNQNQLRFQLNYWESDYTFELSVDGCANHEHFYVKRAHSIKAATNYIKQQMLLRSEIKYVF